MKFGQTLGKAIGGLAIIAAPFSIVISHSVQAAEVVRSLSLEERVERLENQQQSRNMALVDLQYKISELQEEVRTLLGTQEENNYRLNQLTERQREIYKDVDRRLTEAQQTLKDVSSNSNRGSYTAPASSYQQTERPTTAADSRKESQAYEKIFPLVRGKEYPQAVTAYQEFLSQYPSGKFSANAHYWLGQVHYVQGQLEDASRQFQIVRDKFSESTKVPDALLKLGIIYVQEDKTEQAKALFEQLVQEYPETSSARLAERRLNEL